MKPRDIWKLMTEMVSRSLQDSLINSPELILEETLENCTALDEEERVLVRETVLGTLHFEKVCEGILKGYGDCLRRILRDKISMYIAAYLMVFQYTVLGGHRIRELLYRCTTTPRLVEYLEYMLNPQNLKEYSSPYWKKHYDMNFITSTILRPLLEITPHVRKDVIQWLLDKTAARVVRDDETEDVNIPTTRTVAAHPPRVKNDLEERPGKVPPAEVRAMLHTIPEKRPPRIDFTKAPGIVAKSGCSPTEPIGFSFLTRERRHKTKAEEQPACQTESPKSTREEWRQMLYKPVTVHMTAGAIRREAQTYLKRMEERKKSLGEMEAVLRNSQEFEVWQRQEKAREIQQREVELLDRKAQIEFASHNAVQKRKAVEEMKRMVSSQVRADIASQLESFSAERDRKAARQRNQTAKMRRELEGNRRKAVEQAQRDRLTAAENVKAENMRLREDALEEEERIKTQRIVLIQEIRQLRERNLQRQAEIQERNIRLQKENLEDSMYGGMGISMLREKLRQAKEESAQLEEERRAHFGALRQKEREKVEALSVLCANWRQITRRARDEEMKSKQQEAARLKSNKNEEDARRALLLCDALKQKRKDRRTEFFALKAEERRRNNELLLLAKGTSDMEEKHWSQQELGAINRLTVRQNKEFRSGF
ncbi:putative trichohyalin-like [Trypanosoma cruzi]|nr:putative trichohyalin-like [Trypanosoma cruzi]